MKKAGCVISRAPALVKMTKFEVGVEFSASLVIRIRPLNHRVIWILNFHDRARLPVANVEAVGPVLFPRITGQQTGEDPRVAVRMVDLDHIALAVVCIGSFASEETQTDGNIPKLACGWEFLITCY